MTLADRMTKHRELLLALGAVAGLVAALVSIVEPTERALSYGSVVAYVNDGMILRADYDRAVALLQTDRRTALTPEDKKQVLTRLIEEELLLQRARTMGLTDSDLSVRKLLIRSMLETIAAGESTAPTESELRAYYAANQDLFRSPPLVIVSRIVVRKETANAEQRLNDIRATLTDPNRFAETKQKFSDPELIPLPQTPIPAGKLRDYVGASSIEKILALAEGDIAEIDTGATIEFVHLAGRSEVTPAYEDVDQEVTARYARERSEAALRSYLAELKASAEISIAENAAQ